MAALRQIMTSGWPALRVLRTVGNKSIAGCPALRGFRRVGGKSLYVLLLGLLALAGFRQDMHDQPRYKPLAKSDFYPDMRSARLPVQGTVARGQLHEDTYFYTGLMGNSSTPGDYIPFPVTMDVLARGRERFNIYCSP